MGQEGEGSRLESDRPARGWGFRTIVAVLIAIVSALGAVAAWRASVLSIQASDLVEDGLLELVQREQLRAQIESKMSEDLRLLAEYQEHLSAWRLLEEDAERVRGRDPQLAETLEAQAQGELALVRALRPFFRSFAPGLGPPRHAIRYDREFIFNQQVEFTPRYTQLRPEATFADARRAHDRNVRLVLVVALFIAGLFFLTLAQFTSVRIRGIFASAGVTAAAGALVLFLVVGVLG